MNLKKSYRKPWEKQKWKNGIIRPLLEKCVIWNILGIGGLISIALCVYGFFMPIHPILKAFVIIFYGLVGLAGLFFMYEAVIVSIEAWRLRKSQFRMETMPGVIGGKMRGQLVLPKDLTYTKLYIQLTNTESVTLDDCCNIDAPPLGDIKCLYDHIITVNAPDMKSAEKKCLITVEFTIPYYIKDETDSFYIDVEKGAGHWEYKYRWFLHVYIELEEKINLNIEFRVPIFRTKESDPSIIGIAKSEDDPEKRMEHQLTTYNNLDNALSTLGERESGTGRFEEAVAAYREALKEYTCDRMPLQWVATHNNLGNALSTLGERRKGEPSYVDSKGALHYSKIEQKG